MQAYRYARPRRRRPASPGCSRRAGARRSPARCWRGSRAGRFERAGRFHHLVRPDDVVRHQVREEVVAVVRGRAARVAGVVRRGREVDDRSRRRSRPAQRVHVARACRRRTAPAAGPASGRRSKPMTWCPRATSSATAARPMRPADPVTRIRLRCVHVGRCTRPRAACYHLGTRSPREVSP